MSESWIDPARLQGSALTQWYQRSPEDVERERQEAATHRYQDFFFGGGGNDADQQAGTDGTAIAQGIDTGFDVPAASSDTDSSSDTPQPSGDDDPRFTWVATGPNRFQSVKIATDDQSSGQGWPSTSFDTGTFGADDALLSDVSYQPLASPPPSGIGPGNADVQRTPSSQRPTIDPSKTPVFQTGPDGKLHPVPGWHTTGPFDFGAWSHNIHWAGVAKDLGGIVAGIPAFFSGVGIGADLLAALGPEAETAVAEGIAESPAVKTAARTTHSHHLNPKYMGGPEDGETYDLEGQLHQKFHSMLDKAHREAGFPPRGGKTGSGAKWGEHYTLNPGSRDKAYEILRQVAREFDEMHNTDISSRLSQTPGSTEMGPPSPK